MPAQMQRFWEKVDKSGECWLWTGCRCSGGYGNLKVGGRVLRAHRVSWADSNGPIPDGLMVCHHCDVPACVNPAHLFLGTGSDNMRDMGAKGRHPGHGKIGAGCSWVAKLTADDVRLIRLAAETLPVTHAVIARAFGVARYTVGRIVARTQWGHVDG